MGNKPSSMLQDEEIESIRKETGFSAAQIERLYSRFTALDKDGNGSLSRQDCLAIPELAINPLGDRIVQIIFIDCDEGQDRINFKQIIKVLAIFISSSHQYHQSKQSNIVERLMPRKYYSPSLRKLSLRTPPIINPDEPANSKRQKLYFMFKIYDVNADDLIDLNDLIGILKLMVGNYVDETDIKRIADRTLKEADKNCDGYIDFEEFCCSFARKDVIESVKVKFADVNY